jgi:transcriptional regulator with XRE-family HTH domain
MSDIAGAYVGWLLRVNRRFGPDPALRNGRSFASAFATGADRGRVAPSQISRWEHGSLLVSRATVRRYEHLLGLTPDSLVTVRDSLYRTLPPGRRPPAGTSVDTDDRLHELLDTAVSSDAMTGVQWGELTEMLAGRRDLVLHPRTLWSTIAHRLLSELTSREGTDWLQRQEAACRLLEHRAARSAMVHACIDLVEDPCFPAVIEPLTLLDTVADPTANAYVLRELEAPRDDRRYRGALMAAIRKIEYGHFTGEHRLRLTRAVRNPPVPLGEGETRALLEQVRSAYARRAPAAPPAAGERGLHLAVAATSMLGDDDHGVPVLSTLAGQALGEHSGEQRVVAAMAIAHSPFREPVSAALLADVRRAVTRRTGDDLSPALQTLTLLRSDQHRPVLFDLLTGPGPTTATRLAAAWALPHCAGRFTVPQWRQILDRQIAAWRHRPAAATESVLRGIAYGIGTDGHGALTATLESDRDLPPAVRSTAAWLRDRR